MRIMLTNDDGIDSLGLHHLAWAMRDHGEVYIVAPDREFSGAGAAIGALWDMRPEVHEGLVDGIDEAWAVSGPPALCVMFARLGAFGPAPDLIVSGINPGANVGRSVYHSGTIGACLTGRNGGIPGVAVSQHANFGVEGQAWEEMLKEQKWETAAEIASEVVGAMLAEDLPDTGVLNLNVPNLERAEIAGYRWAEVGTMPPRSMTKATLEHKVGHKRSYNVVFDYGDANEPAVGTDTRAIVDHEVSLSWLGRIEAQPWPSPSIDERLGAWLAGT